MFWQFQNDIATLTETLFYTSLLCCCITFTFLTVLENEDIKLPTLWDFALAVSAKRSSEHLNFY